MALENADTLPDPFAPGQALEPVPDSSPLRVSLNTQFESGIPPARREPAIAGELTLEDGVQRMEAALANAVRTEANLGLLARGMKHLATSTQAALAAYT